MKQRFGVLVGAIALASVAWAAGQAQAPPVQIQNGKVEVRKGTAIDREIASLAPARADEPVWVAWRAPMTNGDRDMCSSVQRSAGHVRGYIMRGIRSAKCAGHNPRPQITAPTGPIPLEAGTQVVMLARVIDRKVERIRTVGDDCPHGCRRAHRVLARQHHPGRESPVPRQPRRPAPHRIGVWWTPNAASLSPRCAPSATTVMRQPTRHWIRLRHLTVTPTSVARPPTPWAASAEPRAWRRCHG